MLIEQMECTFLFCNLILSLAIIIPWLANKTNVHACISTTWLGEFIQLDGNVHVVFLVEHHARMEVSN